MWKVLMKMKNTSLEKRERSMLSTSPGVWQEMTGIW